MHVSRKTLMIIGGIVWTVAGVNILRIGVNCWQSVTVDAWMLAGGALAIFLSFHFGVFNRMYIKHSRRIAQKSDANHPLAFLDSRGWMIMAFMIALGIVVRRFSLMPGWLIAMLYTGLSSALIITGLRFVVAARTVAGR